MLVPLLFAAAISVPVPGTLADLAQALGISTPDRGRALPEIVRVVYGGGRRAQLIAYLRSAGAAVAGETVPMPLPARVWSQAVFRRPVPEESLFAAVVLDRSAAFLAYGLAGLDDETLAFLAAHPGLVADLYQRHAAVFAAFAAHLRIRANRVVPPGGEAAAGAWRGLLRAGPGDAEAFIRALMAASRGRTAYLYDVIGYLDAPRAALAIAHLAELAQVTAGLFPEWDVRVFPFTRPAHDLLAMFLRLRQTDLNPGALARDLLSTAAERAKRLDAFAFEQRVFASQAGSADAAFAVWSYTRFPMLMLTLERIGVRNPSVYAALARRAERIPLSSAARARVALAHLQGGLALVDRMRRVGTLDRDAAEALLERFAALPTPVWIDRDLRGAIGSGPADPLEDALQRALAGPPARRAARLVAWEGAQYTVDVAATELARVRRFRTRDGAPAVDEPLALYRAAAALPAAAAARAASHADTLLADALLSLAYAADIPEAGAARTIRDLSRRHEFGLDQPTRSARARMVWSLPERTSAVGTGWRLDGAILGLDVGLAPLGLRRIGVSAPAAPAVNTNQRGMFMESVGMLNAWLLDDETQRGIAEAAARGEERVAALGAAGAEDVIAAIAMDGHRARALRWALVHDRSSVASYFSLRDLVRLGGGDRLALDAWGMSARRALGCLCQAAAAPVRIDALVGRPQLGLLTANLPDLHLRVALTLHDLRLPAALARPVLDAALVEFLDQVRPTDFDDWLAFTRSARAVARERIEDYLAGMTLDGPLVLAPGERGRVAGGR